MLSKFWCHMRWYAVADALEKAPSKCSTAFPNKESLPTPLAYIAEEVTFPRKMPTSRAEIPRTFFRPSTGHLGKTLKHFGAKRLGGSTITRKGDARSHGTRSHGQSPDAERFGDTDDVARGGVVVYREILAWRQIQ